MDRSSNIMRCNKREERASLSKYIDARTTIPWRERRYPLTISFFFPSSYIYLRNKIIFSKNYHFDGVRYLRASVISLLISVRHKINSIFISSAKIEAIILLSELSSPLSLPLSLLSDTTGRTTHWYTKILTVLSEFDVTTAASCSHGQTGRDNKIDGWTDVDNGQLATNVLHITHGSSRIGSQSRADERRGGGRSSGLCLPEFCWTSWTEESHQNSRYTTHQQRIYFRSLPFATRTG